MLSRRHAGVVDIFLTISHFAIKKTCLCGWCISYNWLLRSRRHAGVVGVFLTIGSRVIKKTYWCGWCISYNWLSCYQEDVLVWLVFFLQLALKLSRRHAGVVGVFLTVGSRAIKKNPTCVKMISVIFVGWVDITGGRKS